MKKLSLLLICIASIFFAACSSCSHKTENAKVDPMDVPTEFEMSLTKKDTDEVKHQVELFLEYLQREEYYEAAGMLYKRNAAKPKEIRQLDNDEIEKFVGIYQMLGFEDYKIDYMRYREADKNEVSLTFVIRKGENGEQDMTSKLFLCPIRMANQWKLILLDSPNSERGLVKPEKRDSMRTLYHNSEAGKEDAKVNHRKPAE